MDKINFLVKINFKKNIEIDSAFFYKQLIYNLSLLDNNEHQPNIQIKNIKEYKRSFFFRVSYEFVENEEIPEFYKNKEINIGIKKIILSKIKEITKQKIKINVKRLKN